MRQANVYDKAGKSVVSQITVPKLFDIELRSDLVRKAYDCVSQNKRQPYAVSPDAGKQHSAESWGTGRAMARVPRVKASGTRRSGQAAFANFARKGRMAHPTKTHRRWHKKTPHTVRRHVTLMGVVASADAALVMGRGHRVAEVESLPIIISDDISEIKKTREAEQTLLNMKLGEELERVKSSKTITPGKGKFRGRRYNKRTGMLIVHAEKDLPAFKNIEGVDLANVEHLNLLKLCPGGKLGRLIVWTETAFKRLESLFEEKKGYELPINVCTEKNIEEYLYSPEVQALVTIPNLLDKGNCKRDEEYTKATEEMLAMW